MNIRNTLPALTKGILFFLSIIIFTATSCNYQNTQEAKATQQANAAIDSASKKWFEQYTKQDSIEIIKQEHTIVDGEADDMLIYIDHKKNNFIRDGAIDADYLEKVYKGNHTGLHLINPYRDLYGTYFPVNKINGKFVLQYIGDTEGDYYYSYTITDLALLIPHDNASGIIFYLNMDKKNNDVSFSCGLSQPSLKIDIKLLHDDSEMQLWKITDYDKSTSDSVSYCLMMPYKNAVNLPFLYCRTNTALGDLSDVPYDAINMDSIFASP